MAEQHIDEFLGGDFATSAYQNTRLPGGTWCPPDGAFPALTHLIRRDHVNDRIAQAVGGGRVYHDSTDEDAEFSITALSILYHGAPVTIAAAVNEALSGGDVAHYIYADPATAAWVVNTTGWPTVPHVRIGVITLASGAWNWDSFVDHRGGHALRPAEDYQVGRLEVEAAAADDTLTAAESGKLFTNTGASALVVLTLPTPAAGLIYEFLVTDTDGIKVKCAGGHTIRVGASVSGAGGFATVAVIGDALRIVALNSTEWVALSYIGTWTVT